LKHGSLLFCPSRLSNRATSICHLYKWYPSLELYKSELLSSELFADDLGVIFIFKKPGKIKKMIKGYLDSLVAWLYKWRLKINAKKSCFTVYNKGGRNGVDFDFRVNGERIPYSPNPIFLGIIFDEYLSFNHHFRSFEKELWKGLIWLGFSRIHHGT